MFPCLVAMFTYAGQAVYFVATCCYYDADRQGKRSVTTHTAAKMHAAPSWRRVGRLMATTDTAPTAAVEREASKGRRAESGYEELVELARNLLLAVGGLTDVVRSLLASGSTPARPSDREFEDVSVPSLEEASVTVPEAAQMLGIGAEQVRRLLRADRLAGVNLGGRAGWRVSRRSINSLIRERQTHGTGRTARTA